MDFLYKTRASMNPEGKPRVYFTCHPDDFTKYIQKLSDDILAAQDCAIYYTGDLSAPIGEQDQQIGLGRMNLFVVPVTYQLLTTPNRALDDDIAYAKRNNIPILPFMMEQDLDDLYSLRKNFGDRQYLEPYSNDRTQVKYEDKLKKYLQSVLISDALVSRIRAAFDAYVFLSYRKKDRYYANALMKMIHNIPQLRDLAVWYDEFLTPGESFRESICRMMNNSKLFALVVTPNLLEEKNFVKDVEYPMAIQSNMKIVPVEMIKTDRNTLAKSFTNLPACEELAEETSISEEMLRTFMEIATSENDSNPEHLYLIGLAYLEGIDVEVDRDRAIELITAAAEAGLPEAVETLYRLYSGEDGNAFTNHSKALPWGKRVVEYKAQFYGPEHPDTLTAKAKLAVTLSALHQYGKACAILEEVYALRSGMLGEMDEVTLISLHNLAVEYCNLRQYKKSIEIGKKVYQLRCDILGENHPDTLVTLHNLAQAYAGLGDMKQAVALLEKAYQQSKTAAGAEDRNTLQILRSLADGYHALGEHQKGKVLLETLHEARTRKFGTQSREAGEALVDLAVISCQAGDYTAGFDYMEQAISLYGRTFGLQSVYVQYVISRLDDLGDAAYVAEAWGNAALFWGKALDLRRKCLGVWDHEIDGRITQLLEMICLLDDTEAKETILKRIFDILMIMRNMVYYGTYEGDYKSAFEQMHKLIKGYAKYDHTSEQFIRILEMFYNLCNSVYGPEARCTVKYKQTLELAKAKQG